MNKETEIMPELVKYVHMAKELTMVDAKIISLKDIFFDIRAILKCRLKSIVIQTPFHNCAKVTQPRSVL